MMWRHMSKFDWNNIDCDVKNQLNNENLDNGILLGIEFYLFVSHEGMKRQRFHV